MAIGAIFGYLAGCMANSLLVGLLVSFLAAGLCGALFALLTVSLQANQNVTGLTITTGMEESRGISRAEKPLTRASALVMTGQRSPRPLPMKK